MLLREPGHLFLHLDGLRRLANRDEGARQQVEDFDVLRVRLETQLKLGERLEPVLLSSPLEVELSGDARVTRLDPKVQDALDDFERVVAALQSDQELSGRPKRVDGFVDGLHATAGFRQPQMREWIGRVERDHLSEDVDGVAVATRALHANCHLVVGGQRVA